MICFLTLTWYIKKDERNGERRGREERDRGKEEREGERGRGERGREYLDDYKIKGRVVMCILG